MLFMLSYWFAFAFGITNKQDGLELLKNIISVTLWSYVREFSLVKALMEEYKRTEQQSSEQPRSSYMGVG